MSLLFPIGLINVLVHRNYWRPDERREYRGIVIILSFLWGMNFLPDHIFNPVLVLVLVSLMIIGVAQLIRNGRLLNIQLVLFQKEYLCRDNANKIHHEINYLRGS